MSNFTQDQIASIAAIVAAALKQVNGQQQPATQSTTDKPKSIAEMRAQARRDGFQQARTANRQALAEGNIKIAENMPIAHIEELEKVAVTDREYTEPELRVLNQAGRGGRNFKQMAHSARIYPSAQTGIQVLYSVRNSNKRTGVEFWTDCDNDQAIHATISEFLTAIEGKICFYQPLCWIGGEMKQITVTSRDAKGAIKKEQQLVAIGATFVIHNLTLKGVELGDVRFFVHPRIDAVVISAERCGEDNINAHNTINRLMDKWPTLFTEAEHGTADFDWVLAHVRAAELGGGSNIAFDQMTNKNVGRLRPAQKVDGKWTGMSRASILALYDNLALFREHRATKRAEREEYRQQREMDNAPEASSDAEAAATIAAAIEQLQSEATAVPAPRRGRQGRKTAAVADADDLDIGF